MHKQITIMTIIAVAVVIYFTITYVYLYKTIPSCIVQ